MYAHISLHGFMRVRREAPLDVVNMGHVGISISMAYTTVEKVMVAEIGGTMLAEWVFETMKTMLHRIRCSDPFGYGTCEPGV